MSLLSATQGTPERVWSLVSVIAGNGGTLSKADAAAWLNPGFTRNGESVQVKPTAFSQVLGAATSLGAVEADAATLRLTPACCVTSYATFCHSSAARRVGNGCVSRFRSRWSPSH